MISIKNKKKYENEFVTSGTLIFYYDLRLCFESDSLKKVDICGRGFLFCQGKFADVEMYIVCGGGESEKEIQSRGSDLHLSLQHPRKKKCRRRRRFDRQNPALG